MSMISNGVITSIDICQDAAGRHYVRETKTDHQGKWTRHSMSYANMEVLHQHLTDDTVQWLDWKLEGDQ